MVKLIYIISKYQIYKPSRSVFTFILASLPYSYLYITIFHEHSSLSPRIIVSKLPFVFISILKDHFSKTLHFTSLKFPNILNPIHVCQSIQSSLSIVQIILPLSFILNISIRIIQLTLAFHFPFEPISIVITSISIQIFSLSMSQLIFLLSCIHVAICVKFT